MVNCDGDRLLMNCAGDKLLVSCPDVVPSCSIRPYLIGKRIRFEFSNIQNCGCHWSWLPYTYPFFPEMGYAKIYYRWSGVNGWTPNITTESGIISDVGNPNYAYCGAAPIAWGLGTPRVRVEAWASWASWIVDENGNPVLTDYHLATGCDDPLASYGYQDWPLVAYWCCDVETGNVTAVLAADFTYYTEGIFVANGVPLGNGVYQNDRTIESICVDDPAFGTDLYGYDPHTGWYGGSVKVTVIP